MAGKIVGEAERAERWRVYLACNKNVSETARILGITRDALYGWFSRNECPERQKSISEDDLPVEQLIAHAAARAEKRLSNREAKLWQPVYIPEKGPIVLANVGDPHLDDDGTDWPRLLKDIELLKLPGVYAVTPGDLTNNWTGRLMRLYANQSASRSDGYKYAKWFLTEAGIRWRAIILGNHDVWEQGADIIAGMNRDKVILEPWEAKLTLTFKSGYTCPIWIAHNFKGQSQYNKSHGMQRAARERRGARIYMRGDYHEFHMSVEQLADTKQMFWTSAAAGYKKVDQFAVEHGYSASDMGQTAAFVIDPREKRFDMQILGFPALAAAIKYRDVIA